MRQGYRMRPNTDSSDIFSKKLRAMSFPTRSFCLCARVMLRNQFDMENDSRSIAKSSPAKNASRESDPVDPVDSLT